MRDLPVEDESIVEIRADHVLEHIGRAEVVPTLKEWYRVLAPGGTVWICVPDLESVLREWVENKIERWGFGLDAIYGGQEHEGQFHKTGFCQGLLAGCLIAAGFAVTEMKIVRSHGVDSIVAEAVK